MNLVYNIGNFEIKNYYNQVGNREIEIHNKGKTEDTIKIYYYLSSSFVPYYKFYPTLKPNHWIRPEGETLKNCSFIIVHVKGNKPEIISLLHNKKTKKIKDKIICVGLNKTGTSSLTENLKKLNLKVWGDSSNGIDNLDFNLLSFHNKSIGYTIDLIEKTDADFFQDIPFSCPSISERIINIFPQAKYILTVRENSDKWVKSVKNFWKNYFVNEEFKYNMIIGYHNDLYGNKFNNPTYLFNMFETWDIHQYEGDIDEKLTKVYENHINSVRNTLINNNCDWIEIDVSKKGELKKLTEWLNIENNEEDFLWINKTKK